MANQPNNSTGMPWLFPTPAVPSGVPVGPTNIVKDPSGRVNTQEQNYWGNYGQRQNLGSNITSNIGFGWPAQNDPNRSFAEYLNSLIGLQRSALGPSVGMPWMSPLYQQLFSGNTIPNAASGMSVGMPWLRYRVNK